MPAIWDAKSVARPWIRAKEAPRSTGDFWTTAFVARGCCHMAVPYGSERVRGDVTCDVSLCGRLPRDNGGCTAERCSRRYFGLPRWRLHRNLHAGLESDIRGVEALFLWPPIYHGEGHISF